MTRPSVLDYMHHGTLHARARLCACIIAACAQPWTTEQDASRRPWSSLKEISLPVHCPRPASKLTGSQAVAVLWLLQLCRAMWLVARAAQAGCGRLR